VRLLPGVYHAASVLVHALTALAVFALLRRLSGADWAAGAGALVFAVHPVQVEAVAWASGMKDLLCGLFGVLAAWQYVVFAQGEAAGDAADGGSDGRTQVARRWTHYGVGLICFVLAVLAKPTGIVVPFLCAVIDWVVIRRPIGKVAAALGPWLLITAGGAWIAALVQPGAGVENVALWARPLIAADALAFYLYKLVFPVWLAPDYGRRPGVVMEGWWVWVAWIIPAAVALLVWRLRRERLIVAAALLFVVPLGPLLGLRTFLMQFYSTVADHYLYLPMLGVGLLAAWVVKRYPSRRVGGVVAGVILVLAVRSVFAAGDWAEDLSLWRRTVAVNPRSFAGWMFQGLIHERDGRDAEAEAAYRRSIEVGPHFPNAREAYASFLITRGRLSEAIEPLRQEVRLQEARPELVRPDTTMRRLLLGEILLRCGRKVEAAAEFEEVLRRRPGHPQAAAGLAKARQEAG
jgi:hypothetical protein